MRRAASARSASSSSRCSVFCAARSPRASAVRGLERGDALRELDALARHQRELVLERAGRVTRIRPLVALERGDRRLRQRRGRLAAGAQPGVEREREHVVDEHLRHHLGVGHRPVVGDHEQHADGKLAAIERDAAEIDRRPGFVALDQLGHEGMLVRALDDVGLPVHQAMERNLPAARRRRRGATRDARVRTARVRARRSSAASCPRCDRAAARRRAPRTHPARGRSIASASTSSGAILSCKLVMRSISS